MRRHICARWPRWCGFDRFFAVQWDAPPRRMFCDERWPLGTYRPSRGGGGGALGDFHADPGGFPRAERNRLRAMDAAVSVASRPRILHTDTSRVAALTDWQQALGDWT
jgi:16S rRNA (uracil1498-N3)-methyltransferase